MLSSSLSQKKDKPPDPKSKVSRGNVQVTARRILSSSRRYLQIKNATNSVRQVQLAVILLILVSSSYSYLRCWRPGSCTRKAVHIEKPRTDGGKIEKVQPYYLEAKVQNNSTSPFLSNIKGALKRKLTTPEKQKFIPVVQFYQRPGALACKKKHYIYRNLQQARKLNRLVYFIGPEECAGMAKELDIVLEPYTRYQAVIDWFTAVIGKPIGYQVRWFVLRAFMERHEFARVFYTDSDVMLFADVTEAVEMLYKDMDLVLAVRWPSLKPPLGPSQYVSTAVSGHVSLWTYAALVDFLAFYRLFFKEAVLCGHKMDKGLVEQKAYNDMVPLGWYTFENCWTKDPKLTHPQCLGDKASGVTPKRSSRIRGKFKPKFKVDSLCEPRWCNATKWTEEGWCTFDNNFSVQSPKQIFKYRPDEGMKLPTSMRYTYFEDWRRNGERLRTPMQFLGVHFQAHKKGYLSRGDDPVLSWGSSPD